MLETVLVAVFVVAVSAAAYWYFYHDGGSGGTGLIPLEKPADDLEYIRPVPLSSVRPVTSILAAAKSASERFGVGLARSGDVRRLYSDKQLRSLPGWTADGYAVTGTAQDSISGEAKWAYIDLRRHPVISTRQTHWAGNPDALIVPTDEKSIAPALWSPPRPSPDSMHIIDAGNGEFVLIVDSKGVMMAAYSPGKSFVEKTFFADAVDSPYGYNVWKQDPATGAVHSVYDPSVAWAPSGADEENIVAVTKDANRWRPVSIATAYAPMDPLLKPFLPIDLPPLPVEQPTQGLLPPMAALEYPMDPLETPEMPLENPEFNLYDPINTLQTPTQTLEAPLVELADPLVPLGPVNDLPDIRLDPPKKCALVCTSAKYIAQLKAVCSNNPTCVRNGIRNCVNDC